MHTRGEFYTRDSSQSWPVAVQLLADGTIEIRAESFQRHYRLETTRVSDRIGDVVRTLQFDDGALCEVRDNDVIDAFVAAAGQQTLSLRVHGLEQRWRWVALGIALLVLSATLFLTLAVPQMARIVAFQLPPHVDDRLGRDGLAIMDRVAFEPTSLEPAVRERLQQRFEVLAESAGMTGQVELGFRRGAGVGANAFALPSGMVVVTDELVQLAARDEEIVAVLAHEIGHVESRHTMRMILQDSVTALIFATLLGDLTSISALAAAVPTVLVQSSYSRSFEREADRYAVELLRRSGIDPLHFAEILRRLAGSHEGGSTPGFLSTHPATEERIRRLER